MVTDSRRLAPPLPCSTNAHHEPGLCSGCSNPRDRNSPFRVSSQPGSLRHAHVPSFVLTTSLPPYHKAQAQTPRPPPSSRPPASTASSSPRGPPPSARQRATDTSPRAATDAPSPADPGSRAPAHPATPSPAARAAAFPTTLRRPRRARPPGSARPPRCRRTAAPRACPSATTDVWLLLLYPRGSRGGGRGRSGSTGASVVGDSGCAGTAARRTRPAGSAAGPRPR